MDRYNYDGPEKFRPLSPWAYVGYSLLFSIPIVGWVVLIVLSFNDVNINRRNYARSFFAMLLIVVAFYLALTVLGFGWGILSALK